MTKGFPSRAFVAAVVIAAPSTSSAQTAAPAPMIDYVVRPGDTCPSIARAQYGDAGRIDLIHQSNSLGRIPHQLRPGQVLQIPATATEPPRPQSDAQITFVRNLVDAYTPGQHLAHRDEGLSVGHRVSTHTSASAEVTFSDEDQIQLGEQTLIVILSRHGGQVQHGGDANNTRLERGTLRAFLTQLSGTARAPSAVTTPGAQVGMRPGEAQVSVDPAQTTRLAVYTGRGSIRSAGRTVNVPEGFGSRSDRGRPPGAATPLPPPPVWVVHFPATNLVDGAVATVTGTYANGLGRGRPARVWHVQIARDARFNDLVVDAIVPSQITSLQARGIDPARYLARVSAVDEDGLEGPYSAVEHFDVVAAHLTPGRPGQMARVDVTPGTECALDGAAFARVDNGVVLLAPGASHRLNCRRDDADSAGAALDFDARATGPLLGSVRVGDAHFEGTDGSRTVLLRVSDAMGVPIENARLSATIDSHDIVVAPFSRTDERGIYATTVTWRGNAAPTHLHVNATTGDVFDAAIAPAAPPPSAPAQRTRSIGFDAAAGLMGFATLTPLGFGGGAFAEFRARVPLRALTFAPGFRASYEHFECSGHASGVSDYCLGAGPDTSHLSVDTLSLGLPMSLELALQRTRVAPYVTVAPQLILGQIGSSRAQNGWTARDVSVGVLGLIGADIPVGPGAAFVEIGFRYARLPAADLGPLLAGGIQLGLGYRLGR